MGSYFGEQRKFIFADKGLFWFKIRYFCSHKQLAYFTSKHTFKLIYEKKAAF